MRSARHFNFAQRPWLRAGQRIQILDGSPLALRSAVQVAIAHPPDIKPAHGLDRLKPWPPEARAGDQHGHTAFWQQNRQRFQQMTLKMRTSFAIMDRFEDGEGATSQRNGSAQHLHVRSRIDRRPVHEDGGPFHVRQQGAQHRGIEQRALALQVGVAEQAVNTLDRMPVAGAVGNRPSEAAQGQATPDQQRMNHRHQRLHAPGVY